jgi:hypothetical protein
VYSSSPVSTTFPYFSMLMGQVLGGGYFVAFMDKRTGTGLARRAGEAGHGLGSVKMDKNEDQQ